MKCLVTGGCGFIGSHIVDLLIDKGHDVKVIDNLSTGDLRNLNVKADFIEGDILDRDLLIRNIKDIQNIFHLAAIPRVDKSLIDPIGTHRVNTEGILTLLDVLKDIRINRFIYSSSASVYEINNPYAAQKHIGEVYSNLYRNIYEMPTINLRYFNVYGPRQSADGYCMVIAKFLTQKEDGDPMTIYGGGDQTRDYIHVSDVARANIMAMKYKGKENTFDIGTGESVSVNSLAKMLGGESIHIPNPRGDSEIIESKADISLTEKELDWIPKIKLVDGLKKYK